MAANNPNCDNPYNCKTVLMFIPEHKKFLTRSGWNNLVMQREGEGFLVFYPSINRATYYKLNKRRINHPSGEMRISPADADTATIVRDVIALNSGIKIKPCTDGSYEHCEELTLETILDFINPLPLNLNHENENEYRRYADIMTRGRYISQTNSELNRELNGPEFKTGGTRKKRKQKCKTKKPKARMTKQKRKIKVNGIKVTRNIRISSTGRKYVLINKRKKYLI